MNETSLVRVKEILGEKYLGCESRSLRLEKFVRIGGNSKKEEIEAVCGKPSMGARSIDLPGAITIYAELGGRLIVNQAGGILENAGLCLHRFFGYPMIPGSSVKGIAHHAAWAEWKSLPEDDDERRLSLAEKIVDVFGYPTNDKAIDGYLKSKDRKWQTASLRGNVCFMEAVPYGSAQLVCDIVNSHHSKYYSNPEKAFPYDNESPIPNFFPAVERGAKFEFKIYSRKNAQLAESAMEWLLLGITRHGIGAKTAAGYGWFKDVTKEVEAEIAKRKHEEELRKAREEIKAKANAFVESLKDVPVMTQEQKQEYESLLAAVKEHEKIEGFPKLIEDLNKLKGKLPKESFRGTLQKCEEKAFIGQYVKRFAKLNEDQKNEVVQFLREGTGNGHDLWENLKKIAQNGGDIARGVDAIRAYSRNVLNLGKMP